MDGDTLDVAAKASERDTEPFMIFGHPVRDFARYPGLNERLSVDVLYSQAKRFCLAYEYQSSKPQPDQTSAFRHFADPLLRTAALALLSAVNAWDQATQA